MLLPILQCFETSTLTTCEYIIQLCKSLAKLLLDFSLLVHLIISYKDVLTPSYMGVGNRIFQVRSRVLAGRYFLE